MTEGRDSDDSDMVKCDDELHQCHTMMMMIEKKLLIVMTEEDLMMMVVVMVKRDCRRRWVMIGMTRVMIV